MKSPGRGLSPRRQEPAEWNDEQVSLPLLDRETIALPEREYVLDQRVQC